VPRWKLLEILLRRPSVQTTCSGQCRCTVVCTLVRLGKGEQRHGQLETELLFPRRRHLLAPFSNLTPSVFLHRFCTLGTKKLARTLLRQDCFGEEMRGSWDLFQRKLINSEHLQLKLPLDIVGSVSIKIKHCTSSKRKSFAGPVQTALHRNLAVIFRFRAGVIDKLV
uniref:Uncharacterized protein n=1 Tax=Equus caballus TaxID=9796 RepID=A0A9L0SMJ0_HORSE